MLSKCPFLQCKNGSSNRGTISQLFGPFLFATIVVSENVVSENVVSVNVCKHSVYVFKFGW